MPNFIYRAKDRKGKVVDGSLEADSRAAVMSRLQAMDYFPMDIRLDKKASGAKASSGGGGGAAALWATLTDRSPRIKSLDLTAFYRQMSDLIGAGVPLVKSLTIVKDQMPNPTLAGILATVNSDVQGGATFADALAKHPKAFSRLTVALVRAGETGGLLEDVLARVADYAESRDELRAKVKSALAYPMVMVVFGAGAVVVLLTYVMPKVLAIFGELNQQLPAITLMLMAVSDFLQKFWPVMAVGLAAGIFALRRWIATEQGAYRYHTFLLKVPKVGDLLLKREIAAFARTLGSLLQNGVPILNALAIASEVMNSPPIRREIDKIPESITQGSGMAPTLRESDLFPPVVVNMVAVGEETGHLPRVLLRVAHVYEVEVERSIKTLTSFIEPLIIVALGLVVGVIVIALLLPIFSIDPTQGM